MESAVTRIRHRMQQFGSEPNHLCDGSCPLSSIWQIAKSKENDGAGKDYLGTFSASQKATGAD